LKGYLYDPIDCTKRGSVGCLLRANLKERFPMSSRAPSKSQRSNLALLLMMNACIAMFIDIGQETAKKYLEDPKKKRESETCYIF
jgi:hypothetical protein